MKNAPLPSNEAERLAALQHYGVLDTPPEERFDRITRLTSRQLATPISLVSLVDAHRQWFKSSFGLEAKETPRDIAFCSHAILGGEPLIVENALEDPRFHDNPLVVSGPMIRFYAGAPLVTSGGHRIGTLCAIDREARSFSEADAQFLQDMAAIAVDELELSVALRTMKAQGRDLEERNATLDAFVHTLSHDLAGPLRRIQSFCELLTVDGSIPMEECIGFISSSASTADRLLRDLRGYFQVGRASEQVDCDSRECAQEALDGLRQEVEASSARVEFVGDFPPVTFYPTLLSDLFGNLLSNSIKYRSERPLEITVQGVDRGELCEFSVTDNGIGIAERHREQVFKLLFRLHSESKISGSGMGLAICEKIVRRAGGTIQLDSTEGVGTCVTFTLPKASGSTQLAA